MSEQDDYLWDRSGPPDPEVRRLEQLLAPLAHDRPLDELKLRRKRPRWVVPAAIAAVVAAAAIALLLLRGRGGCDGYTYDAGDGSACLAVGDSLDTGSGSATLAIADIGTAEIAPYTKIVLEVSEAGKRQQLHLDHGSFHAKVNAPPRIFAVTTAASTVTDLGCEYRIDVGTKGDGGIWVLGGKVELESCNHEVLVAPAGTVGMLETCGAVAVYAKTASTDLITALADYDVGKAGALDRVLALAGPADAITLANLAYVERDRGRVLARLAEIHAPPPEVSASAAATDAKQLAAWREDIVLDLVVQSVEEANSPKR